MTLVKPGATFEGIGMPVHRNGASYLCPSQEPRSFRARRWESGEEADARHVARSHHRRAAANRGHRSIWGRLAGGAVAFIVSVSCTGCHEPISSVGTVAGNRSTAIGDLGPEHQVLAVEGLVTEIRADKAGGITGFVLVKHGASGRLEVQLDSSRDYGFPLAHLRTHTRTGRPVLVILERLSVGFVALSIADA
jgi:hypothetical protein